MPGSLIIFGPYSTQGFEKREFTISLQQGPRNTQAQTGRLEPRTLLNQRYVIVRTIGHGGMGAVYQARDLSRQTICAIKEMSLSMVPLEERSGEGIALEESRRGTAAVEAELERV